MSERSERINSTGRFAHRCTIESAFGYSPHGTMVRQ